MTSDQSLVSSLVFDLRYVEKVKWKKKEILGSEIILRFVELTDYGSIVISFFLIKTTKL